MEQLDKWPDWPDRRRKARQARAREARNRVDRLRRAYPTEHQGRVIADVAREMGYGYSTVARYLKRPDRP